jgi:hypothetical protein
MPGASASAPRVLCTGIIVLDDGVPKVPVKSALFVVKKRERGRNIRLNQCHSCATR